MSDLCRLIWYALFANVDRLVFAGLYRLALGAYPSGDAPWRNPITGIAGCCARAASGHAAVAC